MARRDADGWTHFCIHRIRTIRVIRAPQILKLLGAESPTREPFDSFIET